MILLDVRDTEEDLDNIITGSIKIPADYEGRALENSILIDRVYSEDYNNLEDMLKDADRLMFEQKKKKMLIDKFDIH
ncbi:MAG TPA: hypothetical protein DCL21_02265 [Alphaproteobacteria bacterium]|nr:hypothetical protein [Alphaproteobacteria bacterium]